MGKVNSVRPCKTWSAVLSFVLAGGDRAEAFKAAAGLGEVVKGYGEMMLVAAGVIEGTHTPADYDATSEPVDDTLDGRGVLSGGDHTVQYDQDGPRDTPAWGFEGGPDNPTGLWRVTCRWGKHGGRMIGEPAPCSPGEVPALVVARLLMLVADHLCLYP